MCLVAGCRDRTLLGRILRDKTVPNVFSIHYTTNTRDGPVPIVPPDVELLVHLDLSASSWFPVPPSPQQLDSSDIKSMLFRTRTHRWSRSRSVRRCIAPSATTGTISFEEHLHPGGPNGELGNSVRLLSSINSTHTTHSCRMS